MRIVRGRADARWLPSRFNYGLFRLYAYLRMKTARPEPRDVALVIDSNQNRVESFSIGVWTTLTLACYAAGTWFASWPLPLGLLAGIVVGITCLEIPVILMGLIRRKSNNIPLNSALMMALLIGAAAVFTREESWIRFVAGQFLGVVALNAVAAAIVFLLRHAIGEMEHAAGGLTSEL